MTDIFQYIANIFTGKDPLFFTQLSFWVFFTIVYIVFAALYKQLTIRNLFILAASIFFYYKTSGLFFILFLVSIVYDYFIAQAIDRSENTTKRKLMLALSVVFNLGLLFYFSYAYFFTESFNKIFGTSNKVLNYFALWSNNSVGTHFDIDSIILPAGLSFHTFQTISYTVDVYRKRLKPLHNIFDFAFFIMFFPQLILGPIPKAAQFIPQIRKPFTVSKYQFGLALFLILNGLLKKMVIGDFMAVNFIDKIFGNPMIFTGFENLMAVIAYSLQVYVDFSGYTDIATGLALLMGFSLRQNFNSPYKAKSVAEFWKRWHMSLSSWLQDYLYIPLGGNKKGTWLSYLLITLLSIFLCVMLDAFNVLWILGSIAVVIVVISLLIPSFKNAVNTNINLMITMLLGGFWHGATLNFIIWGGLNGVGLVVYKFWKKIPVLAKQISWLVLLCLASYQYYTYVEHKPAAFNQIKFVWAVAAILFLVYRFIGRYESAQKGMLRAWQILVTFSFITFTRIFFRAEDMQQAGEVMQKMFGDLDFSVAWQIISHFWEVFSLMAIGFIVHWLPKDVKWQYKKWFIKSHPALKVLVIVCCVFIIYQTLSADSKPFIYFQF